jgi:hypothetical protein
MTLVVFALVVLLAGCLDPIPSGTITRPGNGSVAGTVKDFCDATALEGVLVTPRPLQGGQVGPPGATASTDGAGAYLLPDLEPGPWQLMFAKKDYQSVEKSVVVTADQEARADLTLPPVPTQLPNEAKLDVLFVVDNSNSMAEEQQALARAFPKFMNALMAYSFTLDLRVGVITTDMGAGPYNIPSCEPVGGDGGVLQNKPRISGCTPPTDPYISVVGSTTNVPGDMVNDAFECIVQLGTGGCGFEQPLAAALKAIDGQTNPGFPRTDSVLAVVVLSDEDDCSAVDETLFDTSQQSISDPLGPLTSFRCFEFGVTCDINDRTQPGPRSNCVPQQGGYLLDVDTFVSQLTAGRGAEAVFFAVISGPTDVVQVALEANSPTVKPACQTAATSAMPGIRLEAVTEKLAPNASFDNICVGDLGTTLTNIARQITEKALLAPCAP